jgi:apolipoprotein D and lipocalin family protein
MVVALNASHALGAAPQPVKAASLSLYSGRWYQVGHILKTDRHPCSEATEDFSTTPRGVLSVRVTCNQPAGGALQINSRVAIVPESGNAKFRMSFFGGLVSQEYWLLDHGADQSWALMATPGGNYLWLLARSPQLDPVTRAAAIASIKALGYDASRLVTSR